MTDTPRCNALESNPLDSFDLRAWKSLAIELERLYEAGCKTWNPVYQEVLKRAETAEAALARPEESVAIDLLRAWVAGCGDEHFSTKDQCRDLLERSGRFLAGLGK